MPGIGIIGGRFGGGLASGTLTIGVFSDAAHTTPITSADFGETIYIKAVVTGITATDYWLYIDNGIGAKVSNTNATGEFSYIIDISGTLSIAMIAADASSGIADSEPFELTVTGIYPPAIAGNVLWSDGALESTYVLNGTFVQQLNDLSGLSNHLSSPTVGNQPLYLDIPNGINSLRSTQFTTGKYLVKSGLSLDVVTGHSIWAVVKFNAAVNGGLFSTDTTANGASGYFGLEQQSSGNIRVFITGVGYSASYPILLGTNYLFEIHNTPTTQRFYINGVLKFTRAIGTAGTRSNFWVNTGFAGQPSATWGDIAVFNTIISPTNETDLRNFLMTKWNIV